MTKIRVIQYATGNVGKHALRGIVERSDLELVGVRVFNPAKVGVDAGDLIGVGPTGVRAVGSFEEVLALSADCVCYNALAETMPGGDVTAIDEICQLLRSGKNVVSTAISHHINPKVLDAAVRGRIEEACAAGGTTFLSAGINPGYAFDLWPTLMSQLSRRIDLLVCSEYCDMQSYTSKSAMAFMGFGLPPEARPPIEDAHADPYRSAYYASLLLLGDAVGVEFDSVTFRREVAVSDVETATSAGVYSPGTVVASRLVFTGHVAGVPRIEFRVIWRVSDVAASEWGIGDGIWTIDIAGDPNVRCRLEVDTPTDSGRSVSITTAMVPLNAIPTVVAARPGFMSHIDLGLHAGGYVST